MSIVRAIMPKEDRFFDMFSRHAEIIVAGADAMAAMFAGEEGIPNRAVGSPSTRMPPTTSPATCWSQSGARSSRPFDRSAITALTSAMDDSLDEMWQTAKAILRYEVETFEPQMLEMSRHSAEAARLGA
jgi:uncharacterized protein Yka (UPF0111/DUF47 family)